MTKNSTPSASGPDTFVPDIITQSLQDAPFPRRSLAMRLGITEYGGFTAANPDYRELRQRTMGTQPTRPCLWTFTGGKGSSGKTTTHGLVADALCEFGAGGVWGIEQNPIGNFTHRYRQDTAGKTYTDLIRVLAKQDQDLAQVLADAMNGDLKPSVGELLEQIEAVKAIKRRHDLEMCSIRSDMGVYLLGRSNETLTPRDYLRLYKEGMTYWTHVLVDPENGLHTPTMSAVLDTTTVACNLITTNTDSHGLARECALELSRREIKFVHVVVAQEGEPTDTDLKLCFNLAKEFAAPVRYVPYVPELTGGKPLLWGRVPDHARFALAEVAATMSDLEVRGKSRITPRDLRYGDYIKSVALEEARAAKLQGTDFLSTNSAADVRLSSDSARSEQDQQAANLARLEAAAARHAHPEDVASEVPETGAPIQAYSAWPSPIDNTGLSHAPNGQGPYSSVRAGDADAEVFDQDNPGVEPNRLVL